jgi:L-malate glycosyltransferase
MFLGHRPDARALMANAQTFIQASAYEGYGMTLIEAALAGVPIITSDVGIVGEVFSGYEHVLAAPVGDPTNLAAHIAWLIEDLEARRALVMSARARALEHLATVKNSPEDIIADILKTTSSV